MNDETKPCTCTDCAGANCTCGCQAVKAAPSACQCGCQQGKPCRCADGG